MSYRLNKRRSKRFAGKDKKAFQSTEKLSKQREADTNQKNWELHELSIPVLLSWLKAMKRAEFVTFNDLQSQPFSFEFTKIFKINQYFRYLKGASSLKKGKVADLHDIYYLSGEGSGGHGDLHC